MAKKELISSETNPVLLRGSFCSEVTKKKKNPKRTTIETWSNYGSSVEERLAKHAGDFPRRFMQAEKKKEGGGGRRGKEKSEGLQTKYRVRKEIEDLVKTQRQTQELMEFQFAKTTDVQLIMHADYYELRGRRGP